MKKRHHVIPRLYLEGFTDPRTADYLWRYDKQSPAVLPIRPENEVWKHFYSVRDASGLNADHVEDTLELAESAAAEPLRKLRQGQLPNSQDKKALSMFFAFLYTRTTNFRTRTEASLAAHASEVKNHLAQDTNSLEKLLADLKRDSKIPLEMTLQEMQECLLVPSTAKPIPSLSLAMMSALGLRLQPIINDMEWEIIRSDDDIKFLTSDNPVCLFHPSAPKNLAYGPGFAIPDVQLTVPVSRDLLLLGSQNVEKTRFASAQKQQLKSLNKRTVINADRFVYASEKSQALLRLVHKQIDSAPKQQVRHITGTDLLLTFATSGEK